MAAVCSGIPVGLSRMPVKHSTKSPGRRCDVILSVCLCCTRLILPDNPAVYASDVEKYMITASADWMKLQDDSEAILIKCRF